MINAFDAAGNSAGQPAGNNGTPLQAGGLWALVFGNGSNGAKTTSLYFTAGEGVFGEFGVKTKMDSPSTPGMPGGY
jgi:hypothetical protein